MPRLWNDTIEAHRRAVRGAILDATVALVAHNGLLSVTMSQIAEETGIGRATLYKYFPDVEAILSTWHEHQIAAHLRQLADARDQAGDAGERLKAVLTTYALIHRERVQHHGPEDHGTELGAFLHRDEKLASAHQRVHHMIRGVLTECVETGDVREDVPPDELTTYCLHALRAADSLPSKAAVHRLVTLTRDGLRP